MSRVRVVKLKNEKHEPYNQNKEGDKVVGYDIYDRWTGKRLGTSWLKNRMSVQPVVKAGRMCAFQNMFGQDQKAAVGTMLLYLSSSAVTDQILPNLVTIVEDYPHHFMVDTGKYKMSVNKTSVYCKTEGLYLFEPVKE